MANGSNTAEGRRRPAKKIVPQLKECVVDLYWEYDRMSSSGQQTLEKLAKLLNIPTQQEMEAHDG